jgi:hypothetical protein
VILTLDAREGPAFSLFVNQAITEITILNGVDGQTVTLLFLQDATGHSVSAGGGNLTGFVSPATTPNTASVQQFTYCQRLNTWLAPLVAAQSSQFLTASVTLSSAEILALLETPVTIIPAQGAGKSIISNLAVLQYKFGTTPYTVPDGATLALGTDIASDSPSDFITDPTLTFGTSANQVATLTGGGVVPQASSANTPFVVGLLDVDTDMTLGNGTAIITVWYTVLTLG